MAEVVTVDVVVRDRGAKTTLKGVGDESKKTGKSFGETGKEAEQLSKKIFDLEIGLKNAAKEFKRTGVLDLDVAETMRKDRTQLRSLVRLRKDLLKMIEPPPDETPGGNKFVSNIIESFSKAVSSGGTTFVGAVVGAVALAAPFIGATVAAAVTGGVGTLGIAGGIAMAARDPRVQDAAKGLGGTFVAEFGAATQGFVGPTVGALGQLKDATIDIAGKLAPEFDSLADHVQPLTQSLVQMVERLLPGLKDGFKTGAVVLSALEDVLPEFGEDLGDMLEMMAKNPEAAAAAMHDLFTVIGETARSVGMLTEFLSSYYEVLIKVGVVTTGWANDMPDWIKAITPLAAVADYFDQADGAMQRAMRNAPHIETHLVEIGNAATNTADELRGLKNAITDAFSPVMDLDEATLRYQKGLIDLQKELTNGKRTLAVNTEEGISNREAILNQIQAIKDLRDATATVPEKVDDANAAYDKQLEALRKNLLSLGYNKDAVNELIDAYKGIPSTVTTEFRYPGLLEAIAKFRDLARLAGSNAAAARALGEGEGTFKQGGDTSGYGGGRASGGYIAPGMTVDVAESGTGVERVKMLRGGGAIVQNMDQWSAAGAMTGGGWSGGGGGGGGHVVWEVRSSGSEVDDLISMIIRRTVSVVGGGSVQKTYGRDDR